MVLIFLVELVALYNLRKNCFRGKIVAVHNRVSGPDSGGMMCIARCGHGQVANLCILEGVTIVAAQRGRGIENFDGINRQGFQC